MLLYKFYKGLAISKLIYKFYEVMIWLLYKLEQLYQFELHDHCAIVEFSLYILFILIIGQCLFSF